MEPAWTLLREPLPFADCNIYPFAVINHHRSAVALLSSLSPGKLWNLRRALVPLNLHLSLSKFGSILYGPCRCLCHMVSAPFWGSSWGPLKAQVLPQPWPFERLLGCGQRAPSQIYLSIYFWLHWVFVADHGLSRCGEWELLSVCSGWASHLSGFSCCRAQALGGVGSVAVVHGLSCSAAWWIFQDQGSNPCPLRCWQVDS